MKLTQLFCTVIISAVMFVPVVLFLWLMHELNPQDFVQKLIIFDAGLLLLWLQIVLVAVGGLGIIALWEIHLPKRV